MKQKIVIAIPIAILCIASIAFLIAKGWGSGRISERNIPEHEKIVNGIRKSLGNNAGEITVSFSSKRNFQSRMPEIVKEWMEDALEETASANEGDYLKYQMGGYETDADVVGEGKIYRHIVRIRPKYYSYRVYEEEVNEAVSKLIEELDLPEDATDYRKASAIYDYVCDSVSYDRIHVKNDHYFLRSTAYAALIQKTATCQGYSVLLYRLFREAGLDARIVTGRAKTPDKGLISLPDGTVIETKEEDVFHAWNMVRVDGSYYYADATWDAGEEKKKFFLCGSEDCKDHDLSDEFKTKEFTADYPIAKWSYSEVGNQ